MKTLQILTTMLLTLFILVGKAQDLTNIKNAKPISFGGGLNVQTSFYKINGSLSRQPNFNYLISGSPTLSIYGVSLPFSFTFSNNQRDFRQPFNQFGLSPTFKWITLHAGYRNVTFSQFGLAGYTILGGGFELKPGNFRIAVMYGRSQKAISEDTSKRIENNLNSISYPAYKRMLGAIKVGYGNDKNYIDLHFLQGKDDSSSLPYKPITTSVLPAKNMVLSGNGKLSFFKSKLILQTEGAVSVYTRDLTYATIDAENKYVNSYIKPNITTQIYTAFETQLNFNHKGFGIGTKYRKVAPDYKSMGAYFFQTDFEQYLANLKFGLLKNKVRFAGSAGVQFDNLASKKVATTARNIYTGNLSINPNNSFGADISFSNFGTSQKAGKRNLSDTSEINQINNSVTISPRYTIVTENKVTTWQAIVGRQALNDKNRFTQGFTEVQMIYANLMWLKSAIKTNKNYNIGLNYNESKSIAGKISLMGFILGMSKNWKEGVISSDFNASLNSSTFENKFNGYVGNLQYNFGWVLAKKHKLSLSLNALFNESKNELAGTSFQEYFARINYGFTL